ncbi:MAG: hypothetical protein ABIS21_05020, partial [Acidimicrobiales bacterium]
MGPPDPSTGAPDLVRAVRRWGTVVILIEFALLLTHSAFVHRRFSLTLDFAIFHQAWDQIATGNLSPHS